MGIHPDGWRDATSSMDAFPVRFARSYIDRLFEERELIWLHQVIEVLGREHELPEEFWVFSRLLEWIGSTRSGVWQYYEVLSYENAARIFQSLERFGFHRIASMHESGIGRWDDPDQLAGLDEWIDTHASEIEAAAFSMIAEKREALNF